MQAHITASVGVAGQNRKPDVESVQRLLVAHRLYGGQIDGRCGPLTVGGILQFQRGFMGKPDGRVDPNGRTLRRLSTGSTTGAAASRPTAAAARPTPSPVRPATPTPQAARPAVAPAAPATSAAGAPAPAAAPAVPATAAAAKALLLSTVPRPAKHTINQGLVAVSPAFMISSLGQPRHSYSQDCQPMTNEKLKKHVVSKSVGPFKVTGLDLAVDSLQQVFEDIRKEQPAVYALLGTAGMLCCRLIRGSSTGVSNHSWGTAIDLKLDGILDRRGDDKVQMGLTLIAPIFNRHGWYWGAAFRTEDAMHFEASRSLITAWAPRLI